VTALREELQKRNINSNGSKKTLIKYLRQSDEGQHQAEDKENCSPSTTTPVNSQSPPQSESKGTFILSKCSDKVLHMAYILYINYLMDL
jgi:hypothetical protein